MDEADVLGDRIAIISNGKLVAHGTSFFLKNNFGRGYYLTFAKHKNNSGISSSSSSSIMNDNFSLPTIDSVDSGVASLSSSYSSAAQLNKAKLTRLQTIQSAEDLSATDLEESMRENEKNILKIMQDPQDLKINEFVKSRFTNAFLVENIGTEMTYSISNRVEHTKNYEKYFFQLERNAEMLGIDSVGISDTTLEEIFIRYITNQIIFNLIIIF